METLVKPGRHLLSAGRGRNVVLWPRAQKVVNPGLSGGSTYLKGRLTICFVNIGR